MGDGDGDGLDGDDLPVEADHPLPLGPGGLTPQHGGDALRGHLALVGVEELERSPPDQLVW